MGFGKGQSQAPTPTYAEQPKLDIPNDGNIQAAATWRTAAGMPYLSSPFRTMDFLQGLPSGSMQVPQFQAGQGQSQFNSNYGGGYTPGWNPGVQAQQTPLGGDILGGILSLLMGGMQQQQQPQGGGTQQASPQSGQQPQQQQFSAPQNGQNAPQAPQQASPPPVSPLPQAPLVAAAPIAPTSNILEPGRYAPGVTEADVRMPGGMNSFMGPGRMM